MVGNRMVVFRTDANEAIASGHVMRCLALAGAFRSAGENVLFLTSDEIAAAVARARGYRAEVLGVDWRNLSAEVPTVRSLLQQESALPLYIVDTYSITADYVGSLSDVACICYLGSKAGDLGPLNALVNYSVDIDRDAYQSLYGKYGTLLLLGPEYAPLRSEFKNNAPEQGDEVKRILVTVGGSDPINATGSILEALHSAKLLEGRAIDVVIGAMFGNRKELLAAYGGIAEVNFHERVKSMSALMADADLAICASGTTVYELSAMGVPAITFSLSAEQVPSALGFMRLGMVDYCGEMFSDAAGCACSIADSAKRLVDDPLERHRLATSAHAVVDGSGCDRIARYLLGLDKMRGM